MNRVAGRWLPPGLLTREIPGGVLLFSTQGESCLAQLDWYGPQFARAEEQFRVGCNEGGHFVPYRRRRSYGITILTGGYVERIMEDVSGARLRLIRFAERGWDRHQDVWSYQHRST